MGIKRINCKGRNVLVIGDTHLPFIHPQAHHFLKEVKQKYLEFRKRKYKEDYVVIHIGDELDYHNISFHTADCDQPFSASAELEEALDWLHMPDGLHELFPTTFVCESNHGSLVYRKGKHHGLPRYLFKSYSQVLKTKKWSWHNDILLRTNRSDVYVCHGRGKIHKLVESVHCSALQGHFHGLHSVQFWKTPNSVYNIWGGQTGCLINDEELAFAYNKTSLIRPILGSFLITHEGRPRLLTMGTDKNNKWDGHI